MVKIVWTIPRSRRHCFLCGVNFCGHAGVALTSASTHPQHGQVTQLALCRSCYTEMQQAAHEAAVPCLKRAA